MWFLAEKPQRLIKFLCAVPDLVFSLGFYYGVGSAAVVHQGKRLLQCSLHMERADERSGAATVLLLDTLNI